VANRFTPRRATAKSASAAACASAVSMLRKTKGPALVTASTLEREMKGTPSACAAVAAATASALVTPPTAAITLSSRASCASACAAPSASPRVSRTASW